MKNLFVLSTITLLLFACGMRVPYTDSLKQQYDLTPQNMMKIQFYTSSIVILERSSTSGNQTTGDDGTLVSNTSKIQDRIIIPANTKCIFEKYGTNEQEIIVRFEQGTGKTLKFATRSTQNTGKYYLVATIANGLTTIEYANETYNVTQGGTSSYIQVVQKKLQRTKRKDRVVKGMKV